MDIKTVIFIGPQGSGKGTQIEKLKAVLEAADRRRVVDIQTGRRFRALAATQETFAEDKIAATLGAGVQYDINNNQDLIDALNAPVGSATVSSRQVYVNIIGLSGSFLAYNIRVQTGFSLGSPYYTEYMISPSVPRHLNPLSVYNSSTGYARYLYGMTY